METKMWKEIPPGLIGYIGGWIIIDILTWVLS